MNSEAPIQSYLDSLGIRIPAAQFVALVSNAYHEVESTDYDRVHLELADARPAWDDCLTQVAAVLPSRIRVLDVGAGTGFASDVVLRCLGDTVERLVCLDPSEAMLRRAQHRLSARRAMTSFVSGDVECLQGQTFDLIVTNSVLHHVIDLPAFLAAIRALLRPGGVYVAGHEPCRAFYENRHLYQWTEIYRRWRRVRRLLSPATYVNRLTRRPAVAVEAATSAVLVERGVLAAPLSPDVIRQLVDIHVPVASADAPRWGAQGFGQADLLADAMRDFRCLFFRTYSHVKDARARMGPTWRVIDRALSHRYPSSGSNLLIAVRGAASDRPVAAEAAR